MATQMNWVRDFQKRIESGDTAAMQEFERLCQPTLVRIVRRAMASQDHSKAICLLVDHELRLAESLPEGAACADPQQAVGNIAARLAHLLLEGTLQGGPCCYQHGSGASHAAGPDGSPGDIESAGQCMVAGAGSATVSN